MRLSEMKAGKKKRQPLQARWQLLNYAGILKVCDGAAHLEIALGTYNLDEFMHRSSSGGITLGEFRDRFLEHREKLVHIGHLSKATYEHDQLSLNTICDRLGINAD